MSNYDINYEDERFTKVESDKNAALSDLEETYAGMINESDKYYQAQIDASKDWADKQTQLQNQQTDQAIKELNQQKEQTEKDYLKEQSGAFVDWQKQSNAYGAEAEKMAASGLQKTGFSESSQVSMYNTYQNRVATARASYDLSVQNFNNSIAEARLQNSSVLAEIAYQTLQKQLELSLQGFQYKNTLLLEKADKKTALDQMYHQRYLDVLQQINTENALAEEIRQYNEKMALEREQFEWQKEQAAKSSSGGGRGVYVIEEGPVGIGAYTGITSAIENASVVDWESALKATGGAPYSEKTLAEMVNAGKLTATVNENGKVEFDKPTTLPQVSLSTTLDMLRNPGKYK